MKKDRETITLKLLTTFLILVISLFSYHDVYTKEYIREYKQSENITEEVRKTNEETIEEETVEEVVEEIPQTHNEEVIQQPVEVTYYEPTPVQQSYEEPVQQITGNRIEIGSILKNYLMTDETGENFYLNHNIYGELDNIGVPYIDFRTNFMGRKTIIYSHSSMQGNGPFQILQNYHNNKSFYEQHPIITIHYNNNIYNYQIFSVYVSVADSEESEGLEYYHRMIYTDEEWEQTINIYKNNSDYDTGVSVNRYDKILILQTCSMDPNYYRKYYRYNLVVMAKLI